VIVLIFVFAVITTGITFAKQITPVSINESTRITTTTTTTEKSTGEVLPPDFELAVELRLDERTAWCNLYLKQTPWSNQSEAIKAIWNDINSRLAPYNLSFRIESVKFSEYGPMDISFTVLDLPVEGGPLNYGYTDYSVEFGWLADWSDAPFTR